jgi:hypothetical protein
VDDTKKGMQVEMPEAKRAHDLVRWRRSRLREAGFGVPLANRLAGDPRYDLHALIELTEHGCPPELAVRILAPFERSSAA